MELTDLLLKTAGFDILSVDSRNSKGTGMYVLARKGLVNGFNPSSEAGSYAHKKYPDHEGDIVLSMPCVESNFRKRIIKPGRKGFLGMGRREKVFDFVSEVKKLFSWEVLTKGNEEKAYVLAHLTGALDNSGRLGPC